jgi:Mrp family chromosome partitioning ATPase
MLREGASARARSYRLLRHRLLSSGDPRVIAVSSARPKEGKTTCAANLALAIAEDALTSVLLLEANLLRPALGGMLGFEPPPGAVAEMARCGRAAPPYPVAALDGAHIHVAALPGAPVHTARLDRTLFSVALLDLRSAYDYIVVDAASVLESGDTDVVGECSDGVLVVARSAESRKADLRVALRQLQPATVLGIVLLDA